MQPSFQTIGIVAHPRHESSTIETLRITIDFLQKQERTIFLETHTATKLRNNTFETRSIKKLGKECDLLLVIGGDGSLLNAARAVIAENCPVIGINKGYLGFLTDLQAHDFQTDLAGVLRGEYREESRFLLQVSLHGAHDQILWQDIAINDVVLSPGHMARMMEFETYLDQQFVCRQRADGLIVSTPTGSTAYALSGGGPIVYPTLEAIVLVPMFPHTLSLRPLVVDSHCCIELRVNHHEANILPELSCDGQTKIDFPKESVLRIQRHANALRLIHPPSYRYFTVLHEKLHWGH